MVKYFNEDEINEILAQHNGDPLMGCYWSRSEYNDRVAQVMIFSNGVMDNLSKVFSVHVRAVSSINMNTINTENNRKLIDGVYLVRHDDTAVLFVGQGIPDTEKSLYKGVGVKLGCKSLVVATEDAVANDISLTKRQGGTRFITKYHDAVADWSGKKNTDDIRDILNTEIVLADGEYIPSVGELYFILLHIRDINAALEAIGGKPLCGWYWTSTQHSATHAWGLYLYDGYANYYAKATGQRSVRAVSAFLWAK